MSIIGVTSFEMDLVEKKTIIVVFGY